MQTGCNAKKKQEIRVGNYLVDSTSSRRGPVHIEKSLGLFGWSNLDLFRLISAYLFSHNTIHSTSRILFTGSAEQPRIKLKFESTPMRTARLSPTRVLALPRRHGARTRRCVCVSRAVKKRQRSFNAKPRYNHSLSFTLPYLSNAAYQRGHY